MLGHASCCLVHTCCKVPAAVTRWGELLAQSCNCKKYSFCLWVQAHIGIVSSATAILKDMEDRGLLRVRMASLGWRTGVVMV